MSAWGPGPFENDDGSDWFADLRDEPSLKMIRGAFKEISDPAHVGYIEVTDGAEAIAAAEVLAELLGSLGDDPVLDDELDELAETLKAELKRENGRDIKRLVKQAIDALEVVLNDEENSELRQMWNEQAEELAVWTEAVISLQERLQVVVRP
ncbi:MAG TPA: DUF4259 domain-containing protein [Burkholderiaceae bacterium]|nr:DUF4259 domain-containing protein [Burkholderiaceae bacterium]HNB44245.1 DUF4259 domain-containing protein [Burkholderiaceae bacterium]HNG79617.1 DUF4259 domain-containing protein [Burkholderiaceae bacterium]